MKLNRGHLEDGPQWLQAKGVQWLKEQQIERYRLSLSLLFLKKSDLWIPSNFRFVEGFLRNYKNSDCSNKWSTVSYHYLSYTPLHTHVHAQEKLKRIFLTTHNYYTALG